MLSVLCLELRLQISHGKGGALLQRTPTGCCTHGHPWWGPTAGDQRKAVLPFSISLPAAVRFSHCCLPDSTGAGGTRATPRLANTWQPQHMYQQHLSSLTLYSIFPVLPGSVPGRVPQGDSPIWREYKNCINHRKSLY